MATKVVRQNTLKATFAKDKPHPTALDIHRWIKEFLCVPREDLHTLQLIGKHNAAYIKFHTTPLYDHYLQRYKGTFDLELYSGAFTTVTITPAEDDYINVRVLNIPPEIENDRIRHALQVYGKISNVENEKWSQRFDYYEMYTGIRVVQMTVQKPIPTNLFIAGHEAYITYPGQEQICYTCGSSTHLRRDCPNRRMPSSVNSVPRTHLTFSDVLTGATSAAVVPETTPCISHSSPTVTTTLSSTSLNETNTIVTHAMEVLTATEVPPLPNLSSTTNDSAVPVPVLNTSTDLEIRPSSAIERPYVAEPHLTQLQDRSSIHHEERAKASLNSDTNITLSGSPHGEHAVGDVSMDSSAHDTASLPVERQQGWYDQMSQEQHDLGDKPVKPSAASKQRQHPYKGEGSKLGFPPLCKPE